MDPRERPNWPNGASCAVLLTFDNFGESFDLLRYGHAGGALSDGVYSPRRGIHRILRLLDSYGVPGTFFAEGWNARKYSALAQEIVAQGHEIAAHGWMHEQWNELDPETEQDLVTRATDAISEAIGEAPRGWRTPSGLLTASTLELIYDAGYEYDSSFIDDDVPYAIAISEERSEELIELPIEMPLDDGSFYTFPGVLWNPKDVADLWIGEFDAAYEDNGFFHMVCHPRWSGRPARIPALERLLDHIQQHDGVWFARCHEVASHARESEATPHYPAPEMMEIE